MQKFTVRAFVLTLALVGATATSVSNAATAKHHKISPTSSEGPVPLCLPSSGNTCGID